MVINAKTLKNPHSFEIFLRSLVLHGMGMLQPLILIPLNH